MTGASSRSGIRATIRFEKQGTFSRTGIDSSPKKSGKPSNEESSCGESTLLVFFRNRCWLIREPRKGWQVQWLIFFDGDVGRGRYRSRKAVASYRISVTKQPNRLDGPLPFSAKFSRFVRIISIFPDKSHVTVKTGFGKFQRFSVYTVNGLKLRHVFSRAQAPAARTTRLCHYPNGG